MPALGPELEEAAGSLGLGAAWRAHIDVDPEVLGTPISAWYVVIRASAGWFSSRWCGFAQGATEGIILCNQGDARLYSLFTLVSPPSAELPARTGRDLLLVSRSGGLCSSVPAQHQRDEAWQQRAHPAMSWQAVHRPGSHHHHHNSNHLAARKQVAGAPRGDSSTRLPVTCQSSRDHPSSSFQLVAEDLMPGVPIDLFGGRLFYMTENGRFCGPADLNGTKAALVCDLNTTAAATKFALLPAAFPSAQLTSLSSHSACGAKTLLLPPPHDIACTGKAMPARSALLGPPVPIEDVQQRADACTRTAAAALSGAPPEQQQFSGAAQAHSQGQLQAGTLLPATRAAQQRGPAAAAAAAAAGSGASGVAKAAAAGGELQSMCDTICKWTSAFARWLQRLLCKGTCASPAPPPANDTSRTFNLTLLLQKPGTLLSSGSAIALATYAPGLMGFPLQQCCPEPDSPHMVDCGVAAGDPIPAACWFNIFKVGAKAGEVINAGDLVMLQSKAFSRWCSITVDGALLCVSASDSNASRNLFWYTQ